MRIIFIIVSILFFGVLSAQNSNLPKRVNIVRTIDQFRYSYQAMATDTAIKDGKFEFSFKSKMLERGYYDNNKRQGLWSFYNMEGALEFSYDYNSGKVSNYERRPDDMYESPCFFLGSPFMLYRFIAARLLQPSVEVDFDVEKELLVRLVINTNGEIANIEMAQGLNKAYDDMALNAARQIPNSWKWIPANINSIPIESEYIIKIIVTPQTVR